VLPKLDSSVRPCFGHGGGHRGFGCGERGQFVIHGLAAHVLQIGERFQLVRALFATGDTVLANGAFGFGVGSGGVFLGPGFGFSGRHGINTKNFRGFEKKKVGVGLEKSHLYTYYTVMFLNTCSSPKLLHEFCA